MAARGLVNGRVPTKWEGFSFPNVTLLTPSVYNKEADLFGSASCFMKVLVPESPFEVGNDVVNVFHSD